MTSWSAPTASPRPSLVAALAHIMLSLWVGIVLFTVTVTLLALSVGLLPVFLLGVAMIPPTFWIVGVFATLERGRVEALLGVRIPAPLPDSPPGTPWLQRLLAQVRSLTRWR